LKHIAQFDRFANEYRRYKLIQSRVAKHLISNISKKGRRILDLGAGSGEVYENIAWPIELFVAADASEEMLSLHPPCQKILCDFDDKVCFEKIKPLKIDQVIAASSLQWSKDLDKLFTNILTITSNVAFAIFTAKTFKTIHDLAGIKSPIYKKEEIIEKINEKFSVRFEVREYKLFFSEPIEMFRYIKRSGVSRGEKLLSYRQMKRVIEEYPYPYLEFEVVFAWSE